ncbi:MAG: hypothetical protein ACK4G1_01110 [Ignavibacteria bacterium]
MKRMILIILTIMYYNNISFPQNSDSLQIFELPLIEIISQRSISFIEIHKYGTDYNSNILNQNGFSLIRRGINFTQDLYAEGFKKGDVKVLIDGEHYHNACPNRMDAPVTRINLIDIESVELTKSSALIGTGIYGKVEYHRSKLSEELKMKSFFNSSIGSRKDFDFSIAGEGINTSVSLRTSGGITYLNGEGKSFKDLYGYKDNFRFEYYNTSFRHRLNSFDLEFGGNFTLAKNISFPFLQMDEKVSKVYSAYLMYKTNKFYFNYTDHLMNNDLRNSTMFMETHAKNLTVGVTGRFYELYYRNWNADNVMIMGMNSINNKLMPNVEQIGINISHNFSMNKLKLYFKGGIQYQTFKDETRKIFYEELYQNIKLRRYFINSGINLSYTSKILSNVFGGLITEFSSDSPESEQLYIAVKRMGTTPDWSGNPNLRQPKRLGLRGILNHHIFNVELFSNFVFDYIDVVKRKKATKWVMTYDNTNAIIAGSNINVKNKIFESNLSFLWGENLKTKSPLAEISPLSLNTNFYLSVLSNLTIVFNHRYENAQKRINPDLKEIASSAWNTLGLGIVYNWNDINFDLRLNNLLNKNYYRFISYSRNPFNTGQSVYEPGRNITFTIYMNKILNK